MAMQYPSMLILDFSKKNTGVAFGRPPHMPKLFSKSFGEDSTLTECAGALSVWFAEMLAVYKPDIVGIEAALPPIASRDQYSARLGLGADFMIKGLCYRAGVRCIEIDGNKWKSRILGTSRLKSEKVKARSKAVARAFSAYGLVSRNNDEADAFCMWLYTLINEKQFPCGEIEKILAKQQFRLL